MSEHSASGTMAGVAASPDAATALIRDLPVVIAGYNGPRQTVVAGPLDAVKEAGRRALAEGLPWTPLQVSHAFHSSLVAPAARALGERLAEEEFDRVGLRVVSTVTGEVLAPDTDVPALLGRQVTDPVLFAQAVELAAKDIDLFVEVGPGRVLSGLAAAVTDVPAVALDTDDESSAGLLRVVAAAYVAGAPVAHEALFHGRLVRPLRVGAPLSFFESPCERAPEVLLSPAVRPASRPETPQPQERSEGETALDMLRRLAAERAELPMDMVRADSHLLDDLHLSSITVGQIVNHAARRMGLSSAQAPTNFATATVRELADALGTLAETGQGQDTSPATVAGAAAWARPFSVDLDEIPLPATRVREDNGRWTLHTAGEHPFAESLRRELESAGVGGGVLVCLPPGCAERDLEQALLGAQAALAGEPGTRFVLVQHGRGAAGLARTLSLEAPHLRTTVAHVPVSERAVGWVVGEVAATTRYAEAHYDERGTRRVPTLRAMPVRPAQVVQPLGGQDVLLVTGGGKGITAECALALASDSGAALVVVGRSDPEHDEELAANLRRMSDTGVAVRYARADVTDAAALRVAVEEATRETGPVTAVLHGAGRNEPGAITGLDMEAFRRTLAPKVDGLRAVLGAVDPGTLRLLVTFGSIIGRAGLRGEGHYATANEWLADLTEEIARDHPDCRALCMEWSVWSGVGMGERLDVVETLSRDGVTPITPDQGVRIMRRLVTDPDAPTVVVVSGRTEGVGTVRHDLPPLPLSRFVGRPLIRYHGVELVVEVELNAGTDLYLADHHLDGNLLFPAVFGMEAMTQVAVATLGTTPERPPTIEQAEFLRPIVVPPDGTTTIRVAAAVTGDDTVEVAVRSAETGFDADHFRARLRFAGEVAQDGPPDQVADGLPPVPLDPAADLYGEILFQGGRFQRLRRYRRAAARHVDADVAADANTDWFAGFLSGELLLGDPGVRDALMHGNQVCVPDATLLPSGIERVQPGGAALVEAGELRYCATERLREGDTYVYDIAVRDGTGRILERWDGLRLRAVRKGDGRGPWVAPLLGPYMERAVEDLTGTGVAVVVEPDPPAPVSDLRSLPDLPHLPEQARGTAERRAATTVAAGRALGHPVEVRHRPDGRPEVDGGRTISASHGAGLTLCVAATGTVGCDVETVRERTVEDWRGLLGPHFGLAELVAMELGGSLDAAATRVWAAAECLRKAGLPPGAPLTWASERRDAWAVLSSGGLRIATLVTALRDTVEPVAFAILTEGRGR
ncbi:SDR family NAD(P)-dependent oxidoreductase, partial [Streptosporangium saharense]|uniref:SDR family NAD(P)-dependent oxidoreductase n=1 Tax=Streptosporangium saharense TaxID=1706840 RepID=UPI003316DA49